ncbi:hypothetical protein U1Q18_048127 [Sarracenia purpurea var. burkii]
MNRDLRRRNSTNQFGVLVNLDSDEHFPSLAGSKFAEKPKFGEGKLQARATSSCSNIVNDALSTRDNIIKMIRDESMDKDFVKLLRTENKSFTAELLRIDKDPDPFSPSKIASLEARIRSLKGLSPITKKIPKTSDLQGILVEGVGKGMGPAGELGLASLVFPKRSEVKRGNEIEVGKTVKSFDSSYEAVSKVQTEDEIDLGKTVLKSGFASEVQSDSDVEGGGNGDCGDGEYGEEVDESCEESASMERGEPGQGIEADIETT